MKERGGLQRQPRRLIEVDLPISRISAHARREKSIRHGHISTLHMWWARRPLAACRAVICASLWPDPADELCPPAFREAAVEQIKLFAVKATGTGEKTGEEWKKLSGGLSPESEARWKAIAEGTLTLDALEPADMPILRMCLLDFIADFANWDNSTVLAYLETSRALTQASHEALGGVPGTRPLVADPFAGGGSIPLEALRVGADAFASDLNPVAVLLNKVVLEYIPKYGQRLADEFRRWGQWVKEQAEKELAEFYPQNPDGAPPVAYLWARTITCEGPNCGSTVPLIRSLWIAKGKRSIALRLVPLPEEKRIGIEIIKNTKVGDVGDGTVKRGSATCPCCGYTTPVIRVRVQLKDQSGGADSSQLLVVVTRSVDGKDYHTPTSLDLEAVVRATNQVTRGEILSPVELPLMSGVFNAPIYGIVRWDLLFSCRQLLAADAIGRMISRASNEIAEVEDKDFALAVKVILYLARGKYLDFRSTLCGWISVGEKIGHTFSRQALGMIFDWTEGVPFGNISGSWERSIEYIAEFVEAGAESLTECGTVEQAEAQSHPLPNDSVSAFISDPPYYNAVPYADLSDFFYVWLREALADDFPSLFGTDIVQKEAELCEMAGWDPIRYANKDAAFYERGMKVALSEGRRVCMPSGIGVLVFAHKSTTGWETLLSALIDAGWIVTASWPIDTERGGRLRAMNSAALGSSVHLVCRPRENVDGSLREEIGEWRDVLSALPKRIHEWMPRLAAEGVVGADAIFACLGPALEIFSRYSRVEKASGEAVPLREYLEQVWAAVSTEALSMIFKDGGTAASSDAAGLEPDARLTAMWLWTLGAGGPNGNGKKANGETEKVVTSTGYTLEFDAARKIAQGLGINLEQSESIVEVKGDKARLLPVSERTRHLFGKEEATATSARGRKKKKDPQGSLFEELNELEAEADETIDGKLKPQAGETVLDRVHQSMILFASGRGEALRRFLVDDGAGTDARFWKLAQSLSALYPKDTDEKRWVDGVLARKKGLGL